MRRSIRFLSKFIIIFSIIILGLALTYKQNYSGKIFSNIYIAGIDVAGKNISEAVDILLQSIMPPEKIRLIGSTQSLDLNTKDIDLSYDFEGSVKRAFNFTRTGNFLFDIGQKFELITTPKDFGLITHFDEEKLAKVISVVSGQNSVEPVEPIIKLVDGKILVSKGSAGAEVSQILLRAKIGENLSRAKTDDIQISINKIDNTLTDMGAELVKARAEKFLGKKLTIKFNPEDKLYTNFDYSQNELLKFINPKGGFKEENIADETDKIANKVNRNPQNPKFTFSGGRVSEFLPALDGIKVENEKLKNQIIEALRKFETTNEKIVTVEAPIVKTATDITTDKVNDLGIKELIGRGTSTYFHSIPGRVHNVSLATSRINGTLVKPGETFSFNDTLGDVSQFTGYKQAYIISGGKTILGDGGGVCQVSTTLFRSLLNAGLPITERAAHAYRVGYYEQNSPPGIDATVYGPSPDLKFTNDTGNYILIEAIADPKHYSLIFELYGTSDGRKSTISKPVISNVSPALPTVYQDDPSLLNGTLKQVDLSAAGARVTFNYSVERNGENIYKKTFVSNYRPWAAVYLRGTRVN
ncbi:MAG TPA: VanW family protein [Patescibacteria group bacterium]|nr:VanW family protein [Patescibacteria group bacterium]